MGESRIWVPRGVTPATFHVEGECAGGFQLPLLLPSLAPSSSDGQDAVFISSLEQRRPVLCCAPAGISRPENLKISLNWHKRVHEFKQAHLLHRVSHRWSLTYKELSGQSRPASGSGPKAGQRWACWSPPSPGGHTPGLGGSGSDPASLAEAWTVRVMEPGPHPVGDPGQRGGRRRF